jgi:hypothetical protein
VSAGRPKLLGPFAPETKPLSAKLSPALRSWVDSCLVPILLKEYFSQIESEKPVATESERMAECAAGKSLI